MSVTADKSLIFEALQRSHHLGLRRLGVETRGSFLIITGHVPSYFLKQLAQETVKPHLGQLKIVNHVTVVAGGVDLAGECLH